MAHPYEPIARTSSEDDTDSSVSTQLKIPSHRTRRSRTLELALVCTSLSLLLTNAFWTFFFIYGSPRQWEATSAPPTPCATSYWLNSENRISKSLHWNTPYSQDNKSSTNELWRDLFPTGQGVVYLPTAWASTHDLPVSLPNANNASESTYFVAAYHQLHCLSVIRSALYKYSEGRDKEVKWDHTIHCLDSLRQNAMCRADDTLLYTEDGNVFGDGQVRECRDWERLREWAEERHA
jgi:hypothetical protein